MLENQKKLEEILMDQIEREANEPSAKDPHKDIAMMAQILINLWSINR